MAEVQAEGDGDLVSKMRIDRMGRNDRLACKCPPLAKGPSLLSTALYSSPFHHDM